jgi:hypothetical protein
MRGADVCGKSKKKVWKLGLSEAFSNPEEDNFKPVYSRTF